MEIPAPLPKLTGTLYRRPSKTGYGCLPRLLERCCGRIQSANLAGDLADIEKGTSGSANHLDT